MIPVFLLPPMLLLYLEAGLLIHEAWKGELTTSYLLQWLYIFAILACWLATVIKVRGYISVVEKLRRSLKLQGGRP